jgi:hypothetical protein
VVREGQFSASGHRSSRTGMLIGDDEIRERFPEEANAIIAELDKDRATQTNEAMYRGKRYRYAVEAWLTEHRNKAG